MRRKIGISVLAILILASVHLAEAQQPGKVSRIGLLCPTVCDTFTIKAFQQGLRELGYVEGKNIIIEYRWAEGKSDRLLTLASELVSLKVDVIVTATTPAIQAAKQATRTIPIVMAASADPVETGLVASLARPGGNVTGLSRLGPELEGKRLELLKEILPKVKLVAFVWDPANAGFALRFKELEIAARALRLQIQSLEVRTPNELESVL